MFSFSRNEERFLLLFLAGLFVGCGFHYYRKASAGEVNVAWRIEQENIYRTLHAVQEQQPVVPLKATTLLMQKKHKVISDKININRASEKEITRLPRIGPVMARRIIEYRQKHGPFRSTDVLLQVKGIGEKTFARIQDRITIE